MKKINIRLITSLIISLFLSQAYALEVDFEEYEISVSIEATGSEDYRLLGAKSNEYQLEMRLNEVVEGRRFTVTRALLNGGTGSLRRPFAPYIKVKVGSAFTSKSNILLPKNMIDISRVKISVFDADFTVPIPGPCCLLANRNDRLYQKTFALENSNTVHNGESTKVTISIRRVNEEQMSYSNYVEILGESIKIKKGIIFAPNFPVSNFYEFLLRNIQ